MVLFVDDLLVGVPLEIGMKILKGVAEKADEELLTTEEAVRKKIMETQLRCETGEMDEEEYRETMSYLKKRLKEVKGK